MVNDCIRNAIYCEKSTTMRVTIGRRPQLIFNTFII